MDKYDNIGDNEIRVIGSVPEEKESPSIEENATKENKGLRSNRAVVAAVFIVLLLLVAFLIQRSCSGHNDEKTVVTQLPAETLNAQSYVEISDTIINNISLHRFIPVNAKPKLEVGVIQKFPSDYILGAMAADFGLIKDKYEVIGGFIYRGNMISYSKSKYGFCALLPDTTVIGCNLTTAYFEKAIDQKGDFFRQYALVHNGEVVSNPPTHKDALRRSLCRLNDGRLCVIDTDMSVSLDSFSIALQHYDVVDAISLMGSGAAVRWAVDKAGRRFIAGADEYDFPDVVNYIVWEKQKKGK